MIGKNNPFNIRYSGRSIWIGLCGSTRGFCDFVDIAYSVRVVMYLFLRTYQRKPYYCTTIADCIRVFCPFGDGDNNPDAYLHFIKKETNLAPLVPVRILTLENWYSLLSAMSIVESSYHLSYEDFINGFNLYYNEG